MSPFWDGESAAPVTRASFPAQGVKNAVPKTILQLMNVEGMTRENVASHLQKYRLYLKRMAGYPPAARLPLDTLQQVQQVLGALVLHSVQLRDTWCLHLGLLVDAKGLENSKEGFTSWLAECMILSWRSAIV